MGFVLLTHSGAITKNFRSLHPIFALQVRFQCLLHMYILSSLQGASGGSSILGNWILAPHIFRNYHKKIQKPTSNICFASQIFEFAPYVYIELPLGSSRRELRFWEMGYWLLTYSGAITKNFRSLQAISALQLVQKLLKSFLSISQST